MTIDLGRRVAVKKITIQVTRVAGQTGAKPEYATVTQIEFLKDIVPENPQNDSDLIRGLAAKAGDGMVELAWNAVRNVTGYEVAYGTSENELTRTLPVVTNKASVTGLENLTTYYFQVTATNGAWRGRPSDIISATPEAASVPGAPSNIQVVPGDQFLRLSWGKTKDATFYQAFYRAAGESAFTQFGGDLTGTSITITGLTNGTAYELAVKAGNSKGVGPFSAVAEGTPEREDLTTPELPKDDRIDNSEIISIQAPHPDYYDHNLCPNFKTEHLVDGDAATYWVARAYWENSTFTYTFAEPHDMNYFIMVPYLQGKHMTTIARYKIRALDENGSELFSGTYNAPALNEKNYMVMPFPMVKGVKSLAIGLDQKTGGGACVSISEIAFYNGDNLADDILALFTDGSFTALKPEVTQETIDGLKARLETKPDFYITPDRLRAELNIADGLVKQDNSVLGLVKNDFQSRSGSADRSYGQGASDLQPLGISAKANATVAIYAQLPEGETVSIVPTQYFGESGVWRGSAIQLRNGRNYITIPQIGSLTDERGGPLYVVYSGSHPDQIKLHVLPDNNAVAIPVLELSNWYNMAEGEQEAAINAYVAALEAHVAQNGSGPTNIRNATEISTPSVLLSLPADRVLAGLKGVNNSATAMAEVMYQDVLAWEETLFVANKVQGIIDSNASFTGYQYPMQTRQNIRYMRMFAGAFMYAAGAHIGIGYGSASGMACGRPTSNENPMLFGWGIAHEIGHNMDKLGKAEITNNIYSLAVQAWDGGNMTKNDTRLTKSGIWPKVFEKVSVGRPGAAGNVFVQLGMYWQLHLAYDEADKPLDFFNRFFTAWKAGEYKGYTYDERVALIASKTAGCNLTEFFTHWGMTIGGEATKALTALNLPAENRAIWYLNDASRTYRLNGGTGGIGSPAVEAKVDGNKVALAITNSAPGSIQGYEVLRDGKPIGFAIADKDGAFKYEDDLGAANNRTYSYSVVPVDKLGNMGTSPVEAGEIRIAYDKTIDASSYVVGAWAGGVLPITVAEGKAPVAVTGIKVSGLAENTSVKVEVKADAKADKWTVAKDGVLTNGVTYFNKPGTESTDTRLWTYDVAAMQITGLPGSARVELLDYPGDRVDFYDAENVTAGKLATSYEYRDAEGNVQTIPEGTVVIMGTYRGDPVYTTIGIEARYDLFNEAVSDEEEIKDMEEKPSKLFDERPMNGFTLLFAELPEDQQVSDISDGIFMFVPDWDAENKLNKEYGWKQPQYVDPDTGELTDGNSTLYPTEIRAVLNRTDKPETADSYRTTSETLWISFPHAEALTNIRLTGN